MFIILRNSIKLKIKIPEDDFGYTLARKANINAITIRDKVVF